MWFKRTAHDALAFSKVQAPLSLCFPETQVSQMCLGGLTAEFLPILASKSSALPCLARERKRPHKQGEQPAGGEAGSPLRKEPDTELDLRSVGS